MAKQISVFEHTVIHALEELRRELGFIRSAFDSLSTKHDLCKLKEEIMSEISVYHEELKTALASVNEDTDTLVVAVTGPNGVTEDIAHLKDIISKIDTNPGPISPEDQKLLTEGLAIAAALQTKTKAIAEAAKALAAATDSVPKPPPE